MPRHRVVAGRPGHAAVITLPLALCSVSCSLQVCKLDIKTPALLSPFQAARGKCSAVWGVNEHPQVRWTGSVEAGWEDTRFLQGSQVWLWRTKDLGRRLSLLTPLGLLLCQMGKFYLALVPKRTLKIKRDGGCEAGRAAVIAR